MMKVLDDIAEAVKRAIDLMPCSSKGICMGMGADGTSTSQIDKIAENTVLDYIQRNNVHLNVLSEEIGFVDNGADETLVLDPVDGTSNAVAGVPLYTISMAVGKSSLADVHTAYLRNLVTGDVTTAEKGKGAFKNGCQIHAKKKSDLDDLFAMIYLGNGAHPAAFNLAKRVRSSRAYGCASIEMELVAEGQADAFMMYSEKYSRSIRVVDIAASILILREAGGEAYDMDGNVLDMKFDLECRANFVAFGDRRVYDFIMRRGNGSSERPTFGINVNLGVPDALSHAGRVMKALEGCEYVLDDAAAAALGTKGAPLEDMNVDVMVTVGGDGTILRALKKNKAPLIGINAGGVGFLAEIDVRDIEGGMKRARAGDYVVEDVFKLSSRYKGEYLADAVNEAVVYTDSVAKIRQYKVYVNDRLITEVRADGIIVSTPAGSTGYAMSLGAPIVDPCVNALVIVPIAAYKFSSRPFVVPADAKVTVEAVMDKGCLLVVDGQEEYAIEGGTKIDFAKSPHTAKFIRFDKNFYSKVRAKLVNAI
ncbi:MAG: NAD(+)/NADH kinase [Candidatus Methanoplasma sp.]|jgi:NAD+ kinase|nr:NAD(+)/NADH kinase [Candidatus Methanoplasma sp.]